MESNQKIANLVTTVRGEIGLDRADSLQEVLDHCAPIFCEIYLWMELIYIYIETREIFDHCAPNFCEIYLWMELRPNINTYKFYVDMCINIFMCIYKHRHAGNS